MSVQQYRLEKQVRETISFPLLVESSIIFELHLVPEGHSLLLSCYSIINDSNYTIQPLSCDMLTFLVRTDV